MQSTIQIKAEPADQQKAERARDFIAGMLSEVSMIAEREMSLDGINTMSIIADIIATAFAELDPEIAPNYLHTIGHLRAGQIAGTLGDAQVKYLFAKLSKHFERFSQTTMALSAKTEGTAG